MSEDFLSDGPWTPERADESGAVWKPKEDEFGDTIASMSAQSFRDAWDTAVNAGKIQVDADDPRILTAFKQSNQYITDMATAGALTLQGATEAAAGAIGEVFGGNPNNEEMLATDIMGMFESAEGLGPASMIGKTENAVDTTAEALKDIKLRANQTSALETTTLGSNLGNVTEAKAPYKPKMFSSGDIALKPGTASVAEFYSPTVETLRNTEFPSKGYKGSELLKLLRDKTPGVRKSELDSLNLGIEPLKRYTKEEVLGLAEKNSYKVTAEVVDNDVYRGNQRQILDEPSVQDVTIKINAVPNSPENPTFLPAHGFTHYDPETIAHARMSLRQGEDGREYMLIEELQSDLLQKKAINSRGEISLDEAYKELTDVRAEEILKNERLGPVYKEHKEYFDGVFRVVAEQSRLEKYKELGISAPPEELQDLEALREKIFGMSADIYKKNGPNKDFSSLSAMMQEDGFEAGFLIERRKAAVAKAPIDDDADTVRIALQSAMAKAQDSDATSLVIPNLERIVTAERARVGTAAYENYMKPGSGFQKTYVSGVNKFVKQLVEEYGDKVKIETVELPYSLKKSGGKEMPNTALKIDFSGIGDVNFRVGRFAQGGMVEDQQMNKLLQEGGMADDGMSHEPTTGNEVPPGSLASEVRDDLDVKLSPGEYVVPADVLRYYGVRFFEDLRDQAKEGMMKMESDGRMGGTPVNADGVPMEGADEELSPEEEQMLMEAMGATGMAEGGTVGGFDRSGFASSNYQMPQMPTNDSSGMTTKKYINPTTKEVRTINFLNGTALGAIPEGFVPWTQALEDAQTTDPKPAVATQDVKVERPEGAGAKATPSPTAGASEGKDSAGMYSGWAEKNAEAIQADPYSFGMKALSEVDKPASGFLGKTIDRLGGGFIGDLDTMGAISDAQAALSRVTDEKQRAALQAAIDKASAGINSPLLGITTDAGLTAKGTAKTSALNKFLNKITGTKPKTATTATASGLGANTTSRGVSYTSDANSKGEFSQRTATGSTAPTTSPRPQSRPASLSGGVKSGSGGSQSSGSKGGTSAGGRTESRRAKGGLITKDENKAKKSNKGLASKTKS